jgi:hypothetical protein
MECVLRALPVAMFLFSPARLFPRLPWVLWAAVHDDLLLPPEASQTPVLLAVAEESLVLPELAPSYPSASVANEFRTNPRLLDWHSNGHPHNMAAVSAFQRKATLQLPSCSSRTAVNQSLSLFVTA